MATALATNANISSPIVAETISVEHSRRARFVDSISYEICTTNGQDRSSTDLGGGFLHTQLLIDTLLKMESTEVEFREFIDVCKKEYTGDHSSLAILAEFEQSYSPERALYWYSKQTILYRLLNKSLRTQNIDLILLFGFFIRDIHKQLEQLQQAQSTQMIRVYRGQLMSSEEVAMLISCEGQLISMNSFLSTTLDHQLALFLLGEGCLEVGLQRVLFEIDLGPNVPTTKPFADISEKSFFPDEQEIGDVSVSRYH